MTSRKKLFNLFFYIKTFLFFRRKTAKGDLKSAKETVIKEEGEGQNILAKASITSDVDDEKEKKKDRELLVK
jgi:hypothetical protein